MEREEEEGEEGEEGEGEEEGEGGEEGERGNSNLEHFSASGNGGISKHLMQQAVKEDAEVARLLDKLGKLQSKMECSEKYQILKRGWS